MRKRAGLVIGVIVGASVLVFMIILLGKVFYDGNGSFVTEKIDVEFENNKSEFTGLMPGGTYRYNRIVIEENHPDCYICVEISKDDVEAMKGIVDYTIEDGWKRSDKDDKVVLTRFVEASAEKQSFSLLRGDEYSIKNSATNEMMEELNSILGFEVKLDVKQKLGSDVELQE